MADEQGERLCPAHCRHHNDQIRLLYDALNCRGIEIVGRILGSDFKFNSLNDETHDKESCAGLLLRAVTSCPGMCGLRVCAVAFCRTPRRPFRIARSTR
jgi:hypothetical protein